jgi:hypothetical protein
MATEWMRASLSRHRCGQCNQAMDETAVRYAIKVLAKRLAWNVVMVLMLVTIIVLNFKMANPS